MLAPAQLKADPDGTAFPDPHAIPESTADLQPPALIDPGAAHDNLLSPGHSSTTALASLTATQSQATPPHSPIALSPTLSGVGAGAPLSPAPGPPSPDNRIRRTASPRPLTAPRLSKASFLLTDSDAAASAGRAHPVRPVSAAPPSAAPGPAHAARPVDALPLRDPQMDAAAEASSLQELVAQLAQAPPPPLPPPPRPPPPAPGPAPAARPVAALPLRDPQMDAAAEASTVPLPPPTAAEPPDESDAPGSPRDAPAAVPPQGSSTAPGARSGSSNASAPEASAADTAPLRRLDSSAPGAYSGDPSPWPRPSLPGDAPSPWPRASLPWPAPGAGPEGVLGAGPRALHGSFAGLPPSGPAGGPFSWLQPSRPRSSVPSAAAERPAGDHAPWPRASLPDGAAGDHASWPRASLPDALGGAPAGGATGDGAGPGPLWPRASLAPLDLTTDGYAPGRRARRRRSSSAPAPSGPDAPEPPLAAPAPGRDDSLGPSATSPARATSLFSLRDRARSQMPPEAPGPLQPHRGASMAHLWPRASLAPWYPGTVTPSALPPPPRPERGSSAQMWPRMSLARQDSSDPRHPAAPAAGPGRGSVWDNAPGSPGPFQWVRPVTQDTEGALAPQLRRQTMALFRGDQPEPPADDGPTLAPARNGPPDALITDGAGLPVAPAAAGIPRGALGRRRSSSAPGGAPPGAPLPGSPSLRAPSALQPVPRSQTLEAVRAQSMSFGSPHAASSAASRRTYSLRKLTGAAPTPEPVNPRAARRGVGPAQSTPAW